jgi:hypothetical protein
MRPPRTIPRWRTYSVDPCEQIDGRNLQPGRQLENRFERRFALAALDSSDRRLVDASRPTKLLLRESAGFADASHVGGEDRLRGLCHPASFAMLRPSLSARLSYFDKLDLMNGRGRLHLGGRSAFAVLVAAMALALVAGCGSSETAYEKASKHFRETQKALDNARANDWQVAKEVNAGARREYQVNQKVAAVRRRSCKLFMEQLNSPYPHVASRARTLVNQRC